MPPKLSWATVVRLPPKRNPIAEERARIMKEQKEKELKEHNLLMDAITRTYSSEEDIMNALEPFFPPVISVIMWDYCKYKKNLNMLWYYPGAYNPRAYTFEPSEAGSYNLHQKTQDIITKYTLCVGQLSTKCKDFLKDSKRWCNIVITRTEKKFTNDIMIYSCDEHDTFWVYKIGFSFHLTHLDNVMKIESGEEFQELFMAMYEDGKYNERTLMDGEGNFFSEDKQKEKIMETWEIWRKIFGPAIIILNKLYSNY